MHFRNLPIILGFIIIVVGLANSFDALSPFVGLIWAITLITFIYTLNELIQEVSQTPIKFLYTIQDALILIIVVVSFFLVKHYNAFIEMLTFVVFGLVLIHNGIRNNRVLKNQQNDSVSVKKPDLLDSEAIILKHQLAVIENNTVEEINRNFNQLIQLEYKCRGLSRVQDGWAQFSDSFLGKAPLFISGDLELKFNEFLKRIHGVTDACDGLVSSGHMHEIGTIVFFGDTEEMTIHAKPLQRAFQDPIDVDRLNKSLDKNFEESKQIWDEIRILSKNKLDITTRQNEKH